MIHISVIVIVLPSPVQEIDFRQIQGENYVDIKCPFCHWRGSYKDAGRAKKAFAAHKRACSGDTMAKFLSQMGP